MSFWRQFWFYCGMLLIVNTGAYALLCPDPFVGGVFGFGFGVIVIFVAWLMRAV